VNLADLQKEIRNVRPDSSIESSLTTWLNHAMDEIAAMYELPLLRLKTPASLATVNTEWRYNITDATHPDGFTYMKNVFRITSSTFEHGFTVEEDWGALDSLDRDHSDTGTSVQRVFLDGGSLGVWPMANDTLDLWWYRRPTAMAQLNDEPDGLPAEFHYKVLVPYVIVHRALRFYPDDLGYAVAGDNTKAMLRWQGILNQGLYGDSVQIGLIPYLTKQNRPYGPRLRGPTWGNMLSGGRSLRR